MSTNATYTTSGTWQANTGAKNGAHFSTAASGGQPQLPEIRVNGVQLRDVSEACVEALLQGNTPPTLFVRGGRLVRFFCDENQHPTIETMTEAGLRGELTRCADFYHQGKPAPLTLATKKANTAPLFTATSPPKDVVQTLLSLPNLPFPPLVGTVECPVLRPDGSVFATPGYDPITHLYLHYAPGLQVPPIPARPTQDDARTAMKFLLTELFTDFPFVEEADKTNMLACLLTPVVRPAITTGYIPLCLLDKPAPGSGATLLADVVAHVATGKAATKDTEPEGRMSKDEWRKKITSLLLAGATIIVFDNLEQSLASSHLSAVLTTKYWGDRLLGKNQSVRVPNNATWIATGNNISLRGDIARRAYRVRVDTQMEQPWTRDSFRHPELLQWIEENRGDLLAALLTMARAWFVAGCPCVKTPVMGDFQGWTKTIGGMLAFAGAPDFLENLDELYNSVDEEAPEWRAFLVAWYGEFGDRGVTSRYLSDYLILAANLNPVKQSIPEEIEWDENRLPRSQKKLGWALKKKSGRVYGQYRLVRLPTKTSHTNMPIYKVEPL
jgi:hypothetical protein